MRILFLAPQPFYQERGTPIAVRLLLEDLSRAGHKVDLLTYHEGNDVSCPGLTIRRIPRLPFLRGIRPGLSLKKLLCDALMFPLAMRMASRNRYDLVHAVEEASFMAAVIRRRYGIPFLYDMDSSLARQVADKSRALSLLLPVMTRLERIPVLCAMAVVPVCDALAEIARAEGARQVFVLRDVSLLGLSDGPPQLGNGVVQGIPSGLRFMYVGNLEAYQGVDLLLDGFCHFVGRGGNGTLVIVGGTEADVNRYRDKADAMGMRDRVVFLGPQPVSSMAALFNEADVLVSPRIKGGNTPMKIYSYLASGKPVLATDLPTHTQVLSPEVAFLVPPQAEALGGAMERLAGDAVLRARLGASGRTLAMRDYSPAAFGRTVGDIYKWVEEHLDR